MPYPWFSEQTHYLLQAIERQQLAHALLLQGPGGLGKGALATWLVNTVLCHQGVPGGCGQCSACLLIKAGTHPDSLVVSPEGKSSTIKVDQVRSMATFLQQTASQGGHKVVLIHQTDRMNVAASNALLKTLEEPAGKTLMVLTSDKGQALLPTIRSRCQLLQCHLPAIDQAKKWLHAQGGEGDVAAALTFAYGAPLTALSLLEHGGVADKLALLQQYSDYWQHKVSLATISAEWAKLDLIAVFDLLMVLVADVIRSHHGQPARLETQQGFVKQVFKHLNLAKALQHYRQLLRAKEAASSSCNLNPQLIVCDALIVS